MQNYCKSIGAIVAASALVAGTASAEVEYELHTGYTTEYIFRGIDRGNDLIEVGADVATEMNGIGLSAGAWYGSYKSDVPFTGLQADTEELQLYVEASKDFGFVTAAIGYIFYHFPQADGNRLVNPLDDAQEVYFSLARNFYGIDTSLTYFWDIETDNDGYTELAASKGFELSPCLTLRTGATLGYLFEESDFTHIQAKVALDWAFTETATLSPYVAHSWALSEGGRNAGGFFRDTRANYNGSSNEFIGGVNLSVRF